MALKSMRLGQLTQGADVDSGEFWLPSLENMEVQEAERWGRTNNNNNKKRKQER